MHETLNDRQAMALLLIWIEDEQVHQLLVWLLIVQIVNGLDAGITAIFGVEALLKIIAFTFRAYIRLNSNKVQHCLRCLVQPSLLHMSSAFCIGPMIHTWHFSLAEHCIELCNHPNASPCEQMSNQPV